MHLRDYLRLLRRQWWLIAVAVVLSVGLTSAVTMRLPRQYTATASFFVATVQQRAGDALPGMLLSQQRAKSYARLLTSDRLAEEVAATAGLGLSPHDIRSRLVGRVEPNTVMLTAMLTDSDPERALRLLEIIVPRFVELVERVETPPNADTSTVKVEVLRSPRVNPRPVSPRPARDLPLAALLGLVLGAVGSVLREVLDTRVRDGAMLRKLTGAPLLAGIPFDGSVRTPSRLRGRRATSRTAGVATMRAEAMRRLRTNLRFVDVTGTARVLTVTSPMPEEGKSTICAELAICLAEAGYRVMLIDADLRRPQIALRFGLDSRTGLTDVLTGDVPLAEAVRPYGPSGLSVLPSGSIPPNPSELLGSRAMADLLAVAVGSVDLVVIDTPPLLPVTDAAVVAAQADGVVLVARQGRTSRAQLSAAVRALRSAQVRLLGCVLSMTPPPEAVVYRGYGPSESLGRRSGPPRRARGVVRRVFQRGANHQRRGTTGTRAGAQSAGHRR